MPASYFKKIMLSSPLHLRNGRKINWTACVGNEGVLVTEDAALIEELQAAISRNVGGVFAIDEAKYDEIKKNPAIKSPPPQWQPTVMPTELDPFRSPPPSSTSSNAAGADEAKPQAAAPAKPKSSRTNKPQTRAGVFKSSA